MRPRLLSSIRFSKDWDRALLGVLTRRHVPSSGALPTPRSTSQLQRHIYQPSGSTYSISRENLFRLSRNSLLPPWWKCRAGRAVGESLSLKIKKVHPSFLTVTDFSSLMLKCRAQRFLSWLWCPQPARRRAGINTAAPPPPHTPHRGQNTHILCCYRVSS